MAKIKSPRPYIIGSYVDDLLSTKVCILYLVFHYLKWNDFDVIKFFSFCGDELNRNFIYKINAMARIEGVELPIAWDFPLVQKLCYDLMDIKKYKLAECIHTYEEINYKRKYAFKKKLQKNGVDEREAFYDSLKTTQPVARRCPVAIKGKGKNNIKRINDSILRRNKT